MLALRYCVVFLDAVSSSNLLHLDHMDRGETSAVAASHLLVHLLHSMVGCECPVLLVHVGGVGARVITQLDAGLGLEDLADAEDLAMGLLHLDHTADEVPEAGPGIGLVLAEKLVTVGLGVWITG